MTLGLVGAVLAGALVLFASGNALGAKGRHQRAADLAAISAAQVMLELYPRLLSREKHGTRLITLPLRACSNIPPSPAPI